MILDSKCVTTPGSFLLKCSHFSPEKLPKRTLLYLSFGIKNDPRKGYLPPLPSHSHQKALPRVSSVSIPKTPMKHACHIPNQSICAPSGTPRCCYFSAKSRRLASVHIVNKTKFENITGVRGHASLLGPFEWSN